MKTKKKNGRFEIIADAADRGRHAVIGSYTPDRLTQIFQSANTGDVKDLCLCGREILERNFDLIGAMEQRTNALSGCSYDIQPGDDTPEAREAAEKFAAALKYAGQFNQYDTFYDFCCNCMSAVVMPFAATEIIWGAGGKLEGFSSIEAHNFNLRNGYVPQLVTDEFPDGMPLEMQENKIIFHYSGRKNDPARAGKIRVLAWLHCFQNYPIKDLFSFVERFGMPFVVAKVDRDTWENERQILHSLIRSFGPNGGGVFTKSTELQLLNAANTGGDNVYFHVLNFTREAIYRLIVGQTASSSDSSGMSNGDAQTAVRQDILESDARALESTVFSKIARPWTLFNYGADVAIPEIHFQVEVPEDQLHLANIINVLSQAGFKADEHELSERFGLKLKYEVPIAPAPASFAMSAENPEEKNLSAAMEKWLGKSVDKLNDIVNLSDDELAEKLKSKKDLINFGDSSEIEKLMTKDMEDTFNASFS